MTKSESQLKTSSPFSGSRRGFGSAIAAVGALTMLLSAAAPALAYHIQPGVGRNGGISPERWTQHDGIVAPVDDPSSAICALLLSLPPPISTTVHDLLCGSARPGSILGFRTGDLLVGVVQCEQNDVSDEAAGVPGPVGVLLPGSRLTGVSLPGIGGLCFMSEGSDPGFGCTTPTAGNEGRSTGYAPAYNGGACPNEAKLNPDPLPGIASWARTWVKIQMWISSASSGPIHVGHPVRFSAEIGGQNCGLPASTVVVYDEQYAYTLAQGHVNGFPMEDPAAGDFGTYTVTAGASPAGLAQCNPGYFDQ
jgi:hypothetical protein